MHTEVELELAKLVIDYMIGYNKALNMYAPPATAEMYKFKRVPESNEELVQRIKDKLGVE